MQHQLGPIVSMLLLCAVTIFVVLAVVGSIVVVYRKRTKNRKEFLSVSGRLRDRMDTTEFMNTLATIDRNSTLDEILENRRRAMWSPELSIHQNSVIVNID